MLSEEQIAKIKEDRLKVRVIKTDDDEIFLHGMVGIAYNVSDTHGYVHVEFGSWSKAFDIDELEEAPEDAEVAILHETSYESEAKCPWCNTAQSDSWEMSDGSIYTCENCEKQFSLTIENKPEYSTKPWVEGMED